VSGFVAGVIPDYTTPPRDVGKWGWWLFNDGDWRDARPPKLTRARPMIVTFDVSGAHEA
jgi:hypothetical protein